MGSTRLGLIINSATEGFVMDFRAWFLVNSVIYLEANEWPDQLGGLISNDRYEFNLAHHILRNRHTNETVRLVVEPRRPGKVAWDPTPVDLETIVDEVHKFIEDF
jgi:hypothetical protein